MIQRHCVLPPEGRTDRPSLLGINSMRALLAGVFWIAVLVPANPTLAAENKIATKTKTQSDQKKRYDIAPGPLGEALSAFAANAGVQLSSDLEITEGKTSGGLIGDYGLQEGFSLLLQGSGLAAIGEGQKYKLVRLPRVADNSEEYTLPKIDVVAEREENAYLQKYSGVATKADIPLQDTPLSVTVIPKKLIDAQGARDLADALKNVASLTVESNNAGRGTAFRSRGFLVDDVFGFLFDGQPLYGLQSPAIELFERIESFRGPASLQFGRAEPGGLINLVRKRPTDERLSSIKVTKGSYDFNHYAIDLGGRIPNHEEFGYRVTLAKQDSESFRDGKFTNRDVAGFSFDWVPSAAFKLTLFGDVVDVNTPFDTGQFAIGDGPARIPRDRNLDLPFGAQNSLVKTLGFDVEWQFNENWRLKQIFTYQDYFIDRNQSSKQAFDEATGDFRLQNQRRLTSLTGHNVNIDLIGDNRLFGMRHRSVFGYQFNNNDITAFASNSMNYASNIFNPTQNFVFQPLTQNTEPQKNDNRYYAFYLEDFIGLTDKFDLMLGVRYDDTREEVINLAATDPVRIVVQNYATTPRFGLVYRPVQNISMYASQSRGFQPNGTASNGSNAGAILPPEDSRQFEVGVKTSWLNSRLALNAAAYRLERRNIPFFNVADNVTELIGGVVNKGVEIEAIGDITENWSIFASYAHVDPKISEGTQAGNLPQAVPRNSARIFTAYDFAAGALRGLSINSGVYGQNRVFLDNNNTATLPGYVRLDAGANYTHKVKRSTFIWRLNLENLLDRDYFFGNSRTAVYPADPLTARVSLEVQL